jgi:hypothetical protein
LNEIKENVRFVSSIGSSENLSELIKDSSLWHSNIIPSVRDLIIIIGSGFVTLYLWFAFHL